MTLLATFKHISSKNADYGAAEAYLTFEHDEFTMKPTLDENGRLIPREDYRISSLNCGGEDFAVACMRANLRYEKNQKREDVKSHHCTKSLARRLVLSTWFYYFFSKKSVFLKIKVAVFLYMFYC